MQVGLLQRHSLWAPDMIEAHSARLVSRLAAEQRLRAAMAKGRALAQRDELQREARTRLAERPTSVERERQHAEGGSRLRTTRAAAFQQRHELRAAELGFADLAAYYERRYRTSVAALTSSRSSSIAPRALFAVICSGSDSVPTQHAHTARAGDQRPDARSGGDDRGLARRCVRS